MFLSTLKPNSEHHEWFLFFSADLLWDQRTCVGGRLYLLYSGSSQARHRHSSKSLSATFKHTSDFTPRVSKVYTCTEYLIDFLSTYYILISVNNILLILTCLWPLSPHDICFSCCIYLDFTSSATVLSNQVKDDDRALSLGSLTIPLIRVLATPDLTMDQWFQLENSGSASRIYIKIVLRVGISHTDLDSFFARTHALKERSK